MATRLSGRVVPAKLARRLPHARGVLGTLLVLLVGAASLGFRPSYAASTAGGELAFSRADGIYVLKFDGAGLRRIWQSPAGNEVSDLRWSPDASQIAFVAPDNNIWTIAADGSGAHALTNQAVAPTNCDDDACATDGTYTDSPRWSPDGSLLSYRLVESLARGSIWTVPSKGGVPGLLFRATDLCVFNERWSPEGNPLFSRCASDQDASNATYAVVQTGPIKPILAGSQVAYSADGNRVAFTNQARSPNGTVVSLFMESATGDGSRLIASDGQNPAWSAAGLLAYEVGGADGWMVHVFDPTSRQDTVLGSGNLGGWAPDGSWIYYTVTGADDGAIWKVRPSGTGATVITTGSSPDWGK